MSARRCKSRTKAGAPCAFYALAGGDRCAAHDMTPRGRKIRAARGRAGGKRNKRVKPATVPPQLATIAGLREYLAPIAGELASSAGDVVARAQAACRVVSTALSCIEADVAAEIDQLKRSLVALHPHLAAELGVAVADEDAEGLQ